MDEPSIQDAVKAWRLFSSQRECPVFMEKGIFHLEVTPYEEILKGEKRPITAIKVFDTFHRKHGSP